MRADEGNWVCEDSAVLAVVCLAGGVVGADCGYSDEAQWTYLRSYVGNDASLSTASIADG